MSQRHGNGYGSAQNRHLYERSHRIYASALRCGWLCPPLNCENCGAEGRIEGHHEDYARPFDVAWLCPSCHRWRHIELGMAGARPASFGARLRGCRIALRLSQTQLAARIGVHANMISRWERGVTLRKLAHLVSLADTFGCTMHWLVLGREHADA